MAATLFTKGMTITSYFNEMTEDERWLGWGYLGERGRCEDAELVETVDAIVLEQTAGWTDEERFQWANSKNGRWVADALYSGVSIERVLAWGYAFDKVKV